MEFLYTGCYGFCYVEIVYLCYFTAFCAYHVAFFGSETFFVFRFGSELVVYDKISIYQERYRIVYCCAAHSEFLALFHVLEKFVNVKAPVD